MKHKIISPDKVHFVRSRRLFHGIVSQTYITKVFLAKIIQIENYLYPITSFYKIIFKKFRIFSFHTTESFL